MGELNQVKVSIGNRSYPLKITKEEEEKVIQAAQAINKKLQEFEDNYAVKDKQDLLAMCALQFASESLNHSKHQGKKSPDASGEDIGERLVFLGSLIDDYLATEVADQT